MISCLVASLIYVYSTKVFPVMLSMQLFILQLLHPPLLSFLLPSPLPLFSPPLSYSLPSFLLSDTESLIGLELTNGARLIGQRASSCGFSCPHLPTPAHHAPSLQGKHFIYRAILPAPQCTHTGCLWRSKDHFVEPVFSVHLYRDSERSYEAVGLTKYLYPLS